jgi:hypothetical protein
MAASLAASAKAALPSAIMKTLLAFPPLAVEAEAQAERDEAERLLPTAAAPLASLLAEATVSRKGLTFPLPREIRAKLKKFPPLSKVSGSEEVVGAGSGGKRKRITAGWLRKGEYLDVHRSVPKFETGLVDEVRDFEARVTKSREEELAEIAEEFALAQEPLDVAALAPAAGATPELVLPVLPAVGRVEEGELGVWANEYVEVRFELDPLEDRASAGHGSGRRAADDAPTAAAKARARRHLVIRAPPASPSLLDLFQLRSASEVPEGEEYPLQPDLSPFTKRRRTGEGEGEEEEEDEDEDGAEAELSRKLQELAAGDKARYGETLASLSTPGSVATTLEETETALAAAHGLATSIGVRKRTYAVNAAVSRSATVSALTGERFVFLVNGAATSASYVPISEVKQLRRKGGFARPATLTYERRYPNAGDQKAMEQRFKLLGYEAE